MKKNEKKKKKKLKKDINEKGTLMTFNSKRRKKQGNGK